ncbi:MAG: hypothetical protein FWC11_04975, partial [Firmicutes bacterium]|nr:hypothetical protein [Bacillota bacterium]
MRKFSSIFKSQKTMILIVLFVISFAMLSGGFLFAEKKNVNAEEANSIAPLNGLIEIINNESELISFAASVGAGAHREGVTVRLARDMNMYGLSWTPIGRPSSPFRGTFDAAPYA